MAKTIVQIRPAPERIKVMKYNIKCESSPVMGMSGGGGVVVFVFVITKPECISPVIEVVYPLSESSLIV